MLTTTTKYTERPIITAQENNNLNNQDNYLLEEDYLDMTKELTEEDKKYLEELQKNLKTASDGENLSRAKFKMRECNLPKFIK